MTIDDLEHFLHHPDHEGRFEGTLTCDALGGERPCTGWFNLLTDVEPVLRKEMRYRFHLTDATGRPLTMVGVKEVFDDPGRDFWADTTTFLSTVYRDHLGPGDPPDDAEVVARGVLRLTVGGLRAPADDVPRYRPGLPPRHGRHRPLRPHVPRQALRGVPPGADLAVALLIARVCRHERRAMGDGVGKPACERDQGQDDRLRGAARPLPRSDRSAQRPAQRGRDARRRAGPQGLRRGRRRRRREASATRPAARAADHDQGRHRGRGRPLDRWRGRADRPRAGRRCAVRWPG